MTSASYPRQRITVAAALVMRPDGQTLLVRKRGTDAFMQPGGKLEPGEAPRAALLRELREEIGVTLPPEAPVWLGEAVAPAAHEAGADVHATLFRVDIAEAVTAGAEIAELAWVRPDRPGDRLLAPLTRDHVLPLARARPPARAVPHQD